MGPLRVIVADDHPMCREAARIAVAACAPDAEVTDAASLQQVLGAEGPLDLIVLDLAFPDSRGIAGLVEAVRRHAGTPVLVVSGAEAPGVERQVAQAGAAGFVPKTVPLTELIAGVRAVLSGERHFSADADGDEGDSLAARIATLTPAELRVLRAMGGGRLNKQIAFDLDISEITVKQHVKAILRKLGVVNRTQAVLALHELG